MAMSLVHVQLLHGVHGCCHASASVDLMPVDLCTFDASDCIINQVPLNFDASHFWALVGRHAQLHACCSHTLTSAGGRWHQDEAPHHPAHEVLLQRSAAKLLPAGGGAGRGGEGCHAGGAAGVGAQPGGKVLGGCQGHQKRVTHAVVLHVTWQAGRGGRRWLLCCRLQGRAVHERQHEVISSAQV